MAEKKKGKGKDAKAASAAELLKGLLPKDPKKNITLIPKEDKDKGSGMVDTYDKKSTEHMIRHYEMFIESMRGGQPVSNLTPIDLLYYHVYGDYRLVSKEKRIHLEYRTLDQSGRENGPGDQSILNRPNSPGIYGIWDTSPEFIGKLSKGQVPWFDQELMSGGAGTKLMLPSIGTAIVQTYGYSNINFELQKFVKEMLSMMVSECKRAYDNYDLLDKLAEYIIADTDYQSLKGVGEISAEYDGTIRSALAKANTEYNDAERARVFAEELIQGSSSKFSPGDRVYVKNADGYSDALLERVEDQIGIDSFNQEQFEIITVTQDDNKKYFYTIRLVGDREDEVIGREGRGFQEKSLKFANEPAKDRTKKGKQWVMPPNPDQLVVYRILLDQMFAVHAHLMITVNSSKFNFGYPSKAAVPRNANAAFKTFPNMWDVTNAKPVAKNWIKKGAPFVEQLVRHRMLFTQMVLKAQRHYAFDPSVFDKFYANDLLEREVMWLSNALSEDAKVIVEQQDVNRDDPLAQLVYSGRKSNTVQFTAPADRRTVFYKIDIPMLKDVMLEYVRAFNEFTISAAYSFDSDKGKGSIGKALWVTIRKNSKNVFEEETTVPFVFFDRMFSEVEKALKGSNTLMMVDPYPPAWAGTNVGNTLRVDPSLMNQFLSPEEYQKRLDEYLDYIFLRYGEKPSVAAAILSAVEGYRIQRATNYEELRVSFARIVAENDKSSQIKTTNFIFRAYNLVISIMRGELSVPIKYRQMAVAEGIEEMLQSRKYGGGIAAAPKGHSMYTPPDREPAVRVIDVLEEVEEEPEVAPVVEEPEEEVEEVPEAEEPEEEVEEVPEAEAPEEVDGPVFGPQPAPVGP